jgi:hypothetical protein
VDAQVVAAELIGLIPEAAMRDFPAALPISGFDPAHDVIETRIAKLDRP